MLESAKDFNAFEIGTIHPVFMIPFLYQMGSDLVISTLEHPGVVKLLESNEKFDVCLMEVFNADALIVSSTKISDFEIFSKIS